MSSSGKLARSTLEELLKQMGTTASVTVTGDDPPHLAIETDQPGNLIGNRGEGIRAIQHLLRVMLVRAGHEISPVVDIDGYREKREEQLKDLAKRKADEVRGSGRLAVLAPMTSYERRVVHTTLSEEDGVVTESLGEGDNRRVMIKKEE